MYVRRPYSNAKQMKRRMLKSLIVLFVSRSDIIPNMSWQNSGGGELTAKTSLDNSLTEEGWLCKENKGFRENISHKLCSKASVKYY